MSTFNLSQSSNPASLGFVKPTAGTPKNLVSNYTNLLANFCVQSLSIQALPSNSGNVYVLDNSTAADKTNGLNIIAILTAGQSIPLNSPGQGSIQPAQYWIDADVSGEGVLLVVYGA
jgi:hypothetical protein